jgi:hypothetical protein
VLLLARGGRGIMKRNLKSVLNGYFSKLEKELHIEFRFDYSILDKANLLLGEITKNLERKIFKGNKYLFYYYLFFDLPFRKDRIIITITVSVGEKVNTYTDIYYYLTKDRSIKLKNGSSSLFIVVFDTEVKYRWENWERVTSVFEKIAKKENLELNSGKNGGVKFIALEIPIEAYVFEYNAV